jgi:hypothetical protein
MRLPGFTAAVSLEAVAHPFRHRVGRQRHAVSAQLRAGGGVGPRLGA